MPIIKEIQLNKGRYIDGNNKETHRILFTDGSTMDSFFLNYVKKVLAVGAEVRATDYGSELVERNDQ